MQPPKDSAAELPENVTLQFLWTSLRASPHVLDPQIKVAGGETLLAFQCGLLDEVFKKVKQSANCTREAHFEIIRTQIQTVADKFDSEFLALIGRLKSNPDADQLVLRASALEAVFTKSLNRILDLLADPHPRDVRVILCKESGGIKAIDDQDVIAGIASLEARDGDMARAVDADPNDPKAAQKLIDRLLANLRKRLGD